MMRSRQRDGRLERHFRVRRAVVGAGRVEITSPCEFRVDGDRGDSPSRPYA
jgi:hypothetical protein